MEPTLEIFAAQLIVVGSFNPPIFSPEWLKSHGLIGSDDCDAAIQNDSYAITPEIARFETDWFSLQVVQNQFALVSKGAVTPQLKDLLIGIFTIIDQTPVSAAGLNYIGQYKIPSRDAYHRIGDILAPKTIWAKFYSAENNESLGLAELTIQVDSGIRGNEVRATERVKKINLSVSPFVPHGVQMKFNDHNPIIVDVKNRKNSAELLIDLVNNHWESSMEESKKVFIGVLKEAMA